MNGTLNNRNPYSRDSIQIVIAELATVLAKSLYSVVTDKEYIGNAKIEPALVSFIKIINIVFLVFLIIDIVGLLLTNLTDH